MPTMTFSTGVPDLDDLLEGVRPGDNLVFHAPEAALYRPFVQALAGWCQRKKRRLVYIRADGSLDDVLDGLPAEDRFDVAARRQDPEGLMVDLKAYVKDKGRHFCYVCDNLTAMRPLLGGEAQLRAFFADELCPLLFQLETVAYWLLLKGEHPAETVATIRHATQVFLDLSAVGPETFLWPLKVLGRYSGRMLTPNRLITDLGGLRLIPLTGEAAPYVALFREKGAELAESLDHLADAQAQLSRHTHVISTLLTTLQSASATLGRTLDEREALEDALRLCDDMLGLKSGWILRLDDEGRFSLATAGGLPPALEAEDRSALRWTPCRCQRLLLAGEVAKAVNIVHCERLERAQGDKGGLLYHVSVPIQNGEQTWGLLNLAYAPERQLTPEELEALTALGTQLAVALQRAQAHKRVQHHAAELSARQRVTESMLRVVDLEERMRIALKEIRALVGSAVRGAIYLVEGERLVLRVQQGFSNAFLALARDLPLEACPWAQTPTVAQAPWEGTDPVTEALRREAVMAWTSLPLGVEGRLEGVLILADRRAAALTPDMRRALSALADQVSVVLHNARLYAQSQERLARLTTLREIDRAIAAQLSLAEVVTVVVERLHPHVHADAVGLSLIDWERKRTVLTHLRLPGDVDVRGEAFTLSDSLLEWLAVRRQPVIIYDLLGDPRVRGHREVIRQHGLKSYLGVPLIVQDQAIGVLHVFTVEPHAFSAEEVDFFATMAGQTAISIQNARMYEAALRRGEALAVLAQSTLSLTRAGPEPGTIRTLLEGACRATGADRGAWLAYNEANRTLHPEALVGFPSQALSQVGQRLAMGLSDPWAPAIATAEGRPIYLRQTHGSPLWPDFDPSLNCAYCVPLTYSGRLYGVFALLSEQEDAFSAEERALADTFAAYAAGALNNAHLFQETRQRAAHLEALNVIIAAAAAVPDLPELLEIALQHTLEALELEMGVIWVAGHITLRGLPPAVGQALREIVTAIGQDMPPRPDEEDWPAAEGPLSAVGAVVADFGIRDAITAPLLAEGRPVGGLSVATPNPRAWSPEEVALVEAVGRALGDAVERARLFARTREHATLMSRLQPLSEALNRPRSVPQVLEAIGQGAMALSSADRAALCLRNPDDTIACPWSQGLSPAYLAQVTARARELPGGRLLAQPDPVLIPDVENLPEDSPLRDPARAEGYRAAGLWPLVYEGRVLAAVGCYYDQPHTWSKAEQEVMRAFCRQAAIALENARLYGDLADAYVETILALAKAMDARDSYTGDHSQRLAAWAEATARKLGCHGAEVEAIRWAALLHDIGKIGVPDEILRKPEPLTEAEWAVMKQHPQTGAQIVAPVKHLAPVAPIIRHHQEKWDGTGYPDALQGEAIPLGARVLAVVDAYGAMTDERVYREARSHREAVAELRRCAGTQFDPQVVEAFLRVLEHGVDITRKGDSDTTVVGDG